MLFLFQPITLYLSIYVVGIKNNNTFFYESVTPQPTLTWKQDKLFESLESYTKGS